MAISRRTLSGLKIPASAASQCRPCRSQPAAAAAQPRPGLFPRPCNVAAQAATSLACFDADAGSPWR
ncbi:MAG: hypothetical protein DI621_28460 [Pseudomonas protegens]|nr:MAG: hypothetical protein DI621_28460 [Pseudomonas protegens]